MMKRNWIAFAAALALSASLIPCAAGAQMKEYTSEQAEEQMDLYAFDGFQTDIPGTDFTFWYRDTMIDVELTAEKKAEGYLMVNVGLKCMLSVIAQDCGMTLEEYTRQVQESISKSAQIQKVNDVDFVIYDEPEHDGVFCRVAATALSDGKILEFVYVYKDDSVVPEIDCSIGSICTKDS